MCIRFDGGNFERIAGCVWFVYIEWDSRCKKKMKKWWCTLMEEMKRQNWGSHANVTILWSRHKMSLNRHHSVLVSRKSVFSLSSVQPCMFSAINSIGFCFPFLTTKKMRSCAKKLQPYACFSPASFGCCCARDSLLYSKMHLIFLMMRSKCHNITLSLTVWVCRFAVGFHITITNLYFVVFAYFVSVVLSMFGVCSFSFYSLFTAAGRNGPQQKSVRNRAESHVWNCKNQPRRY